LDGTTDKPNHNMEPQKWLNEDRFKDIANNKSTFSLKFEGLLILENFLNLRTLFLLRSFLVDFRLMNIAENAQRFFLFLFLFLFLSFSPSLHFLLKITSTKFFKKQTKK